MNKDKIKNKNKVKMSILYIIFGIKESFTKIWKMILLHLYCVIAFLLWSYSNTITFISSKVPFYFIAEIAVKILIALILIMLLLLLLYRLGKPIKSNKIHSNFIRSGFVNKLGEFPILLRRYKNHNYSNIVTFEFDNVGISIEEWNRYLQTLETVLNCKIASIGYGKSIKTIVLNTIKYKKSDNKIIYWKNDYLSNNDFELVLGESYFGKEMVNLNRIPHIFIGGSTGSGKSVLLKTLAMQCIKKNAQTYIADFKGGVDYIPIWHDNSTLVFDRESLIEILEKIVNELEERKHLFYEMGCSSICDYNNSSNNNMRRIVFACDEIAEILDKTGLSKTEKEIVFKIENKLSIIARQGRAFGIHLILATQRPDANILSGQIRNNIDLRICGKADSILSQIILDNASASIEIPKDSQGKFITNTGIAFQSYWFDERVVF